MREKQFLIFLFVCTVLLASVHVQSSPGSGRGFGQKINIQDGFPSVFDLNENREGVIIILKPSTRFSFKGHCFADMNKDGYDDILASARVKTAEGYIAALYIVYGGPQLPSQIMMDNPQVMTASSDISCFQSFQIIDCKSGDVNGDGNIDVVFNGLRIWPSDLDYGVASKLYIRQGKGEWYGHDEFQENSPDLKRVYDSIIGTTHKILNDFAVSDIDGDNIDDILLPYFFEAGGTILTLYISYGNQTMPYETDLSIASPGLEFTTIHGDTLNKKGTYSLAVGDFDKDGKQDIVLESGRMNVSSDPDYYGITHLIYGSGLARQEKKWFLTDRISGLVNIYRSSESFDPTKKDFETQHKVATGDLNGDGYDDIFIGYPKDFGPFMNDIDELMNSEVFIIFGSQEFIVGGDISKIPKQTRLESPEKGDLMGSDFAFGDINGDGFQDCLIAHGITGQWNTKGQNSNVFHILYGMSNFSEYIQIDENSPFISNMEGCSFADVGDFNGDGYDDILGNGQDTLFVIPGRGMNYANGEAIVKPLAGSQESRYTFGFDDGISFRFHFIKGRSYKGAELILTNHGRDLPDSLGDIPNGSSVVSFLDAAITNMPVSYELQCSFSYIDSIIRVHGMKETDLSVSYWDESNLKWTKVECSVDTLANRVTFLTDHLSLWALADKNDPVISNVEETNAQQPFKFELEQNYPNPFNPATTIRYRIPEASLVTLKIYNILGQEVRMLADKQLPEGSYEAIWDGRDSKGVPVASGIYLYRITSNAGYSDTKKLLLMK